MLQINEILYRAGGRVIFDRATATVNKGDRAGLVGRNGSGKTTLLKLIAGSLSLDGGEIGLPRTLRVGTVAQEAPSGRESLIDTVLAADTERTALMAEAEHAKDPARIAEIHERLATIGAESAPARAAQILAGLGFDETAQQRPCAELSGGWRMRVALAALLFSEPDLLLLDEPTNHLDLEAVLWLEGYLKTYPGTLILVSHDRDLLNSVAKRILHLEAGKIVAYNGNYDRFERTRAERMERQAAMRSKQLVQRRHIQTFIDRFRYKASKARQAQSRIKALERMEPISAIIEERTIPFTFPQPVALPPPILTLEDASVGYDPAKPVLKGLNLRLDMDDRVALLGANGNGKSTFSRLLAGRLKPMGGRLVKSSKLTVGYFSQDQAEELDLEATPLQLMERVLPDQPPAKVRAHLGRFGFGEHHAHLKVGRLSGGEKARLLFALMTRHAPHLLLLDEPTNHLDMDARESLIQAINEFEGAVVLVTHDPHIIELTADRLWLVANGTVEAYDGDMDDYRALLRAERRAERGKAREDKTTSDENGGMRVSKKDQRRANAEARAAVSHLRKAVRDAEARVERLNRQKAQIDARLADPEVYNGPTAKLMQLQIKFSEIKTALAKAEDAWLDAQAAVEDESETANAE